MQCSRRFIKKAVFALEIRPSAIIRNRSLWITAAVMVKLYMGTRNSNRKALFRFRKPSYGI
jgi:hypothetical protein